MAMLDRLTPIPDLVRFLNHQLVNVQQHLDHQYVMAPFLRHVVDPDHATIVEFAVRALQMNGSAIGRVAANRVIVGAVQMNSGEFKSQFASMKSE
ncbi:unnamed protein product [Gongylonema pulchrum]|uniref:Ferritin domain-containing protein n=1 Tax=Gongylonema pulchrum TaxID=637853 RepID=A0A183E6K4_9BILA|nr:unnamed protein product [Gongylonema pulchrum]